MSDTDIALSDGELNATTALTGRPVSHRGVRGRGEATGRDIFFGIREAVGVVEGDVAVCREKGFDVEAVAAHGAAGLPILELDADDRLDGKHTTDVLSWDSGILLPAAIESVIRERNAARIREWIIAEGANGPTTQRARRISRTAACSS